MAVASDDRTADLFAPFVADPTRAGLFVDFDGTLAPIVDDPDSSRPLPGAVSTLGRLASHLGLVTVVSGRPVEVLARFFPEPITLSGLYGLQRRLGGRRDDLAGADAWAPVIDDAVERARALVPHGVRVEHKGLSLTLHYREHPDQAERVERWAASEAASTGLVTHAARMSVELRPPLDADKRTAVLDLAEGLGAVCYFGDDVGDLPAFAALELLATRGVVTVKVAVHSAEQDPRLGEAADLEVDGPEGVLAILTDLLERLSR